MDYLEDIRIGERTETGRHTFTAEEIKRFAVSFDPQPFHIDETAAAQTHFGALCASGWHTAAVCMRYLITHRQRLVEAKQKRGEPIARFGPSPGFRNLRWIKPVYVGDTLTFATEPLATRVSESRPDWGLATSLNTGVNQNGDLVYSFEGAVFVERRPGAV